jgi:hypothetical protein
MSVSSFRRICCYHSTSFYKTFNGNFKEGTAQRITLETRTANFQMVIQWMHTGAISLPTSTAAKSKKITTFLEFLVLADQIVCLGHSTASLHRRKLSLSAITNTSLLSMSVQPLLPRSHPTRKLFAQSWLGPCLSYIHPGEGYTRSLWSSVQKEFRFEKDLKESVECALDLA